MKSLIMRSILFELFMAHPKIMRGEGKKVFQEQNERTGPFLVHIGKRRTRFHFIFILIRIIMLERGAMLVQCSKRI